MIVALTAALAVGVSTGCAGIAGGLGIAGCLGSSLINAAHNIVIDNIPDDTGDVDILPWTDTEPSEDESGSETKPESETQPASQGTPVYRVDTPSHYEEYDPEEFYALCDELARLGAEG